MPSRPSAAPFPSGARRLLLAAASVSLLLLRGVAVAQTPPLQFWSWSIDAGTNAWWNDAVTAFRAGRPAAEVLTNQIPRGDYATQIMLAFAGGTPPDVERLDAADVAGYASQNWLADLTPLVKHDGIDLANWAGQSACSWHGKTLCITLSVVPYMLYVNTALLTSAGVAVPTSWPAYRDAARRITDAGHGVTFGIGLPLRGPGTEYVTQLFAVVTNAGGAWTNAAGDPNFATPAVADGLRRWADLQRSKLTPDDKNADQIRDMFLAGHIGMLLDGPWLMARIAAAKPDVARTLQMVPPPGHAIGRVGEVVAMSAGLPPDRQALGWDFIKTLISAPMQARYAALTSQPSPRPAPLAPDLAATKPTLAMLQQAAADASAISGGVIPPSLGAHGSDVAVIIAEECQRMVSGAVPPAEAAARIQSRLLELRGS